jgi:hypothetical protein
VVGVASPPTIRFEKLRGCMLLGAAQTRATVLLLVALASSGAFGGPEYFPTGHWAMMRNSSSIGTQTS